MPAANESTPSKPTRAGGMMATPETLLIDEVETVQPDEAAAAVASAGIASSPPPSQEGSWATGSRCASPLDRLDAVEDARFKAWKQGESLGKGAYGEVYRAMVAGRFMAVKKINLTMNLPSSAAEKEINSLLLEINTLKRLRHPRIVRYHGCIRQDSAEDPALLIFLEFMPSGSIKAVLSKFGPYGIGLARKYTRQILEGLEFLHSERIVHRDVKGANILIDSQGDAKLADFGACRELETLHNTLTGGLLSIQGSIFWMAPEVMKYKAGRRSDIWSAGCTLIEMLTAEPPWPNLRDPPLSVTETLKKIVDGPEVPPIPDKSSPDCRHLLELVLLRDHTKRPYAADLLKHRFVTADASGSPSPKVSPEAWTPSRATAAAATDAVPPLPGGSGDANASLMTETLK
eukprot:TRINITY_DN121539_c0_g1_i1.p1 TRINITY_DN121539_c0_g1~~TRINITY_DN121539_c0_g1_i1.p1  ORF type:complete len:403 (-),score=77.81 TRINITY_DN121539_c0_g1_i1:89-1297(-)